jgi:hypothetical protein
MRVLAALISAGYFGFADWAYAAEAPSTKPNQNTQEQRPHCFAPHIISTDATNAGG